MKILVIALIVLMPRFLSLWVWGRAMPSTHTVTAKREIKAPIENVWQKMTDWQAQANWRKSVDRVDVLSSDTFVEYPKKGAAIKFAVVQQDAPRFIELAMSGPAELSFADGVTTIQVYEAITQHSVIGKILSRLFFDLDAFTNDYLQQLDDDIDK